MDDLARLRTRVCEAAGITEAAFRGRGKTHRLTTARSVFIYEARKRKYSIKEIGDALGRDSTTVAHFLNRRAMKGEELDLLKQLGDTPEPEEDGKIVHSHMLVLSREDRALLSDLVQAFSALASVLMQGSHPLAQPQQSQDESSEPLVTGVSGQEEKNDPPARDMSEGSTAPTNSSIRGGEDFLSSSDLKLIPRACAEIGAREEALEANPGARHFEDHWDPLKPRPYRDGAINLEHFAGQATRLGLDLEEELRAFELWAKANGKRMADWSARFAAWLDKAGKMLADRKAAERLTDGVSRRPECQVVDQKKAALEARQEAAKMVLEAEAGDLGPEAKELVERQRRLGRTDEELVTPLRAFLAKRAKEKLAELLKG